MINILNKKGEVLKTLDCDSLRNADLRNADLRNANLSGADLDCADLRGADLCGADLNGTNLRNADLRDANLRDANLRNADLRGAYLNNADLGGARFKRLTIKNIKKFEALYKYVCYCIVDKNGEKYISLGCHTRRIEDWEAHFWNNPTEFPNDNSEKSRLRVFAYETCKSYFNVMGW